jgi:hypothetical protein
MSGQDNSTDAIRTRIKPILDRFAVKALKAWLKVILLPGTADTRTTITELVVKHIAEGKLAETALETALIGFEEASDMRIYLFRMVDAPKFPPNQWLLDRLKALSIPLSDVRVFAGQRSKPMSPIYAHLEGDFLRVKWAEEHRRVTLDDATDQPVYVSIYKRIVLNVDFRKQIAELRLNPPENRHSHYDGGRPTDNAYFKAYLDKAKELLNCSLQPIELRPIIKRLIEEEDPRIVRLHIENHTNQRDLKLTSKSSRADIRDDPEWKAGYQGNGESWAWDSPSFYWLPKVSSGFLARELFSRIDVDEGFIKVNADCSDGEVEYVVTQIRAREAKPSEISGLA